MNTPLLIPANIFIAECYHCNEPIRENTRHAKYGNSYVCEIDIDDFFECDNCTTITPIDEKTTVDNSESYCEACTSDNTSFCDDCDNTYTDDISYYENLSKTVCDMCLTSNYSKCDSCDQWVLDTYNCDTCETDLCDSCNGDHYHDEATRDTDTSLIECNTPGKFIKIKRFIGCEIEAENGDRQEVLNSLNSRFGVQDDGSLSDGTEITTPPLQLAEFEENIHHATTVMTEAGFSISRSCGLHIHLDARDFKNDYDKISNLFRTFYAIESIIYATLPNSRYTSSYCKPLNNDYKFTDINKKISTTNFDKKLYKSTNPDKNDHYNEIRYHGLNLHSIFNRGTVEYRYHSGTLSPEKIINWTNFLLHATEYALNNYDNDKIVSLMKQKDNKKKFDRMCKLLKIKKQLKLWLILRINQNSKGFFDSVMPDREETY